MSEKKKIATREGFGKEIVALGKENPDILVVDIDIGKSCKTGDFRKELPQQYLNVVVRYLTEEEMRKYRFSTVVWYHLHSELSNYARDQVGKPQEIPIEFYCEIPAPGIAPIDDGLWRVIEDNLTYKQFEAIQFRNQGYTNREIADLCGVKRKAIEKRFARIRKTLSNLKEF